MPTSRFKNHITLHIIVVLAVLYYVLDFPNAIYVPIGAILATLYILLTGKGKIIISNHVIIVALFCLLYFFFDSFTGYSMYGKVVYGYTLFVFYLLGTSLIYWTEMSVHTRLVKRAIDIIYYGLAAFITICIVYTYLKGYGFSPFFRTPLIIWRNEFGSSTHFGTMSALPLAISMLKATEANNKTRFRHVCITIAMVIINLLLSNRVVIVFSAVFLIFAIIIKNKGKPLGNKTVAVLGVLILFIVLYGLYRYNVLGIKTSLAKIPAFSRIQLLDAMNYSDPRLERQIYIIANFYKSFNGGGYFYNTIGDSHNVWLDMYDRAGILPFLLFLSLTVVLVRKIYYLYKTNKDDGVNSLCIITLIGFLVSFVEEPAFRSTPSYMVIFFFSSGLIISYCNERSKINSEIAEWR